MTMQTSKKWMMRKNIELDKIDLSVPEGVSIEDPVRMYLKEIGKVRF